VLQAASDTLRSIPYSLRYFVNASPTVYPPLARLRHRDEPNWRLSPVPELVIEGIGRSGNTFVVDAFERAQPTPVRVLHHTHSAGLVIRAAELSVPILLLVREPSQVVVSQMILRGVPARAVFDAWVRFHRRLLPYRDRMVIGSFEEVTTDLGVVVDRVNARFGTAFERFDHSDAAVSGVFDAIDARNRARFGGQIEDRWVAKPTDAREEVKAELRAELGSPRIARVRAEAGSLYRSFVPDAGA
jgi:hypothetical protein